MNLSEILEFPTTLDTGPNGNRVHESVFRSYQCLEKVRELLRVESPPSVVIEIIDHIMEAPHRDKDLSLCTCDAEPAGATHLPNCPAFRGRGS